MTKDAIEREVGQLLWVGFRGTEAPDWLLAEIACGAVGAAILFARNIRSGPDGADLEALLRLTDQLRGAVETDDRLWIAVDQEGGRVQRLRRPATEWPPMLRLDQIAATDVECGAEIARAVGRALATELAAVGVDVNFAPVLDVHTNPDNPIIGDRAFATDPDRAARLALAFAAGQAEVGLVGCGKHFPGHGDTCADSHLELPRVEAAAERLRAVELRPFALAASAATLPMIMTAHVVFPALDPDRPATLSPTMLQSVLRDELGFRGLVVSDDLDMAAIRDCYEPGDAAVRAVDAGCDLLLLCADRAAQQEARAALVARAVGDSRFRERVAAAAAAVRAAKRAYPAPAMRPPLAAVGAPAHLELAARMGAIGS